MLKQQYLKWIFWGWNSLLILMTILHLLSWITGLGSVLFTYFLVRNGRF